MRIIIISLLLLLTTNYSWSAEKPMIRFAGFPIWESVPLALMTLNDPPWEQKFKANFKPVFSPDMLRATISGKQTDATIVTTAIASIFYNKGIPCKVAIVLEPSAWIISRVGNDNLHNLKGTFLFPFGPGEMPELFYKVLVKENKNNLLYKHTGSAMEAVNLLLIGEGNHALLSEPAVSLAIRKSIKKGVMKAKLVKSINLRNEWQAQFPGHRLAATCIAFFGIESTKAEIVSPFREAYLHATMWVTEHPKEALSLIEKKFPSFVNQLKKSAQQKIDISIIQEENMESDSIFFLKKIQEISPEAIGGKVPDSGLFEVNK